VLHQLRARTKWKTFLQENLHEGNGPLSKVLSEHSVAYVTSLQVLEPLKWYKVQTNLKLIKLLFVQKGIKGY
jgi:hypothetical protein